ncbi:hypothetical protein [Parasphingorhabdus sp.]|uniref:hypothetical protein n=1 Tax=Parasphingorhabdus sp. TaxID=2709688 RepID=UPI003D283009
MSTVRHCERSEAIQSGTRNRRGLPRRCAPHNDGSLSLACVFVRDPAKLKVRLETGVAMSRDAVR